MSVIRTVFLGTPEFARYNLEALTKDPHFQVVGVVTQPDRPQGRKLQLTPSTVKAWAVQQGLPVFTPQSMRDPDALAHVKEWKAETAVVVAYGQILSQEFLDLFPGKVVNLHGSLLPKWRGAAPIQRAIMAGDKETGVSLQVMVKKLDAGDVLGFRRVAIDGETDAVTLYDQLKILGAELLGLEFMDYLRGHLVPTPQDESQVTIAPKITNDEAAIDWTLPNQSIFNRVRGLVAGPGSFTMREKSKLKIHKVKPVDGASRLKPGEVLVEQEHIFVGCGQGRLELLVLQPESRGKMLASDYIRGYPFVVGEVLKK